MAKQPKHRSAASGITISVGVMQIVGDLVLPTVTGAGNEEKLVSICPVCTEPHKVSQFYRCQNDPKHTDFLQGMLKKAKEVDDTLVALTADQVEAAKESDLPEKLVQIRVHRKEEVETRFVPSGTEYVFRPSAPNPLYGVLIDFLQKNEDTVLVGMMKRNKLDHLMRLSVDIGGQLVLQELNWPEDIREFETPAVEHDEKLLSMAETLISSMVAPYDEEDYKKKSRERLVTLVTNVSLGQSGPVTVKASTALGSTDWASVLEQAIASQA